MLAKEDILAHDESFGNLSDVVFCESNAEDYPEITEMIGVEGSGFPIDLEQLVLFEDDDYTGQFPSLSSIESELEDEDLDSEHKNLLLLKRQHLELARKFPFDFLNLDFCGYYYPQPPGILQINRTIERMVELQNRENRDQDGRLISIDDFVLAVTCKFDENVPEEAFSRLQRIISENRDENERYSQALLESRGTLQPEMWREGDSYDFFLGSWPKELLTLARNHGWSMRFQDYFHYERENDEGHPYHIVSIVCRLTLNERAEYYVTESIRVLDRDTRVFIDEVDRKSAGGKALLTDLEDIVAIRNERARLLKREELPAP